MAAIHDHSPASRMLGEWVLLGFLLIAGALSMLERPTIFALQRAS